MPELEIERQRREQLWRSLPANKDALDPQLLRSLAIYGGAQGIWVDKAQTANGEIGPDGATVSILHTGRHYPDDLSDDGLIYHYPRTSRPSARDAAEVQATKKCNGCEASYIRDFTGGPLLIETVSQAGMGLRF